MVGKHMHSHQLHLLKLSFQGILEDWGNFKDAIHENWTWEIKPIFHTPKKLTFLLQNLRDKIPEYTDLLMPVTQQAAHNAYGWLIVTPAVRMGKNFTYLSSNTSKNHFK